MSMASFSLLIGIFFIFRCKCVQQEIGIDINPEDDVHLVYVNNYTNVLHIKMKWVTFVFKDELLQNEGSAFYNYSLVAKELKGKNFFTKLNATVMPNIMDDFLTKVPSVIFFSNKTAYVYHNTFSYEELFRHAENFSRPDWEPEPSPIIFLDDENFDSTFVKVEYGLFLMIGYEDPTRNMLYLGRMKTVSEKLKVDNVTVFIVNNLTHPNISKKLNYHALGVLNIIRKGKLYVFDQEKQNQISSMVKHAKESKKFGSQLISEYKKGVYMIRKHDKLDLGMFVASFASETSSWFSVYQEIVHTMRDNHKFFHTFDKETARKFGCKNVNCLTTIYPEHLQSPYDSEVLTHYQLSKSDLTDFNQVKKYILRTCRPLIGHLSNYVHVSNIYRSVFPKAVLYMDVNLKGYEYKENQFYIKKLWKIAVEFKDIAFVFCNREDHESSLKEMNLEDSGKDVDFIIYDLNNYYYIMSESFTDKNARNFVESFVSGNLRPVLKSAPLPEKEFDEYAIRTLVGNNFDQVVLNNNQKDMLILFYTDWCDHCKKFKPIFVQAAQKFKDYTNLTFSTFDCANNDPPPEYLAQSYPTIYFAPSNSKKNPIKYERKQEDGLYQFSKFIESHLTTLKISSNPTSEDL